VQFVGLVSFLFLFESELVTLTAVPREIAHHMVPSTSVRLQMPIGDGELHHLL